MTKLLNLRRRGRGQSSNSRRQTPRWLMSQEAARRLHGRALQSCSKVTICRTKPDKLLTGRCSTFVPQRAQTAGKHQECGQNEQKGASCRRHNKNSTGGTRFPAYVQIA
ncbi:uncharacterized protein LOC144064712 isoform X2 [Stigmatopora argus]